MKEDGPRNSQKPVDFVDWEKVRQTKEYERIMCIFLRDRLECLLLSPEFIRNRNEILLTAEIPDDFEESEEEYLDLCKRVDPATEEQKIILEEISRLETIDEIKDYAKSKGLNIDINALLEELEKEEYFHALKVRELARDPSEQKNN